MVIMDTIIIHGLKKSVTFYWEKSGIFLCVTFASKRVRIYTKCRCRMSDWDASAMRATGKGKDQINEILNKYENIVIELFREYKYYPSVEKFREDIKTRIVVPEKPQSIFERFDEYIDTMKIKRSWTIGTIKHVKVCKNHLFKFDPCSNALQD